MSSGHQRITWRRNNAENFNRLSRVHERYRRQTDRRQRTDGRTTTYSEHEHEFTFAKNVKWSGGNSPVGEEKVYGGRISQKTNNDALAVKICDEIELLGFCGRDMTVVDMVYGRYGFLLMKPVFYCCSV